MRGKTKREQGLGEGLRTFRDGRDENNLAEFPVALLTDKVPKGQKTLEFEDTLEDWSTGKTIRRRVCITGSDKFGLPTAKDEDVLLALVQLTKIANDFTSPEVSFTKHEIIELLGWQNRGWAYSRVEESLHRWKGVSIHYWNAWRDNAKGTWRNSEALGVIEYFSISDGRQRETTGSRSRFIWNTMLFESFRAGYLKKLDFGAYRELERPASKRAYRFLDKRFWHGPEWEFELRQFACEKLGFSRSYDTGQLKERLTPALAELVQIGFIEPVKYRKERPKVWKISIAKKQATKEAVYAKQDALVMELIEFGVEAQAGARLVERYERERILEKLAYVKSLLASRDKRVTRNPPGFLVAAIRSDYPVNKEHRPKVERQPATKGSATPRCSARVRRESIAEKLDEARWQRLDAHLATLSESEHAAFQEAAIASDRGFLRERFLATGGNSDLRQEDLRLMLRNHLENRSADGKPAWGNAA